MMYLLLIQIVQISLLNLKGNSIKELERGIHRLLLLGPNNLLCKMNEVLDI